MFESIYSAGIFRQNKRFNGNPSKNHQRCLSGRRGGSIKCSLQSAPPRPPHPRRPLSLPIPSARNMGCTRCTAHSLQFFNARKCINSCLFFKPRHWTSTWGRGRGGAELAGPGRDGSSGKANRSVHLSLFKHFRRELATHHECELWALEKTVVGDYELRASSLQMNCPLLDFILFMLLTLPPRPLDALSPRIKKKNKY